MILAGDIGGTKTLIGLFEEQAVRPVRRHVRAFATLDYPDLMTMIGEFLADHAATLDQTHAAFGVAGPVIDQHSEMTNVPWHVDAAEMRRAFAFRSLRLLNDLEAMAYALPVLMADELCPLQEGHAAPGNLALVAAGTGLGQAVAHWTDGRHIPVASEGGHTDFAARTDREMAFVRMLRARYGRAELERVLSGPGLVNLAEFAHMNGPCTAGGSPAMAPDDAAIVSASALQGRCLRCMEALDMFVEAFGAVAGNLALTAVTIGGVFLGGGIAPRILPAFQRGSFIEAFRAKGPMRPLLERMPVHVILNAEAGLLGAAVYASAQSRTGHRDAETRDRQGSWPTG